MIKPGEKITFVVSAMRSGSIHLTVKEGTMLEFGEEISRVKAKNGRITFCRTDSIRLAGEKNALTEAVHNRWPNSAPKQDDVRRGK